MPPELNEEGKLYSCEKVYDALGERNENEWAVANNNVEKWITQQFNNVHILKVLI